MLLVGFGFMMTFLNRYSYSSLGFSFIVTAYVLEWSLVVRGWIDAGSHGHSRFSIDVIK